MRYIDDSVLSGDWEDHTTVDQDLGAIRVYGRRARCPLADLGVKVIAVSRSLDARIINVEGCCFIGARA